MAPYPKDSVTHRKRVKFARSRSPTPFTQAVKKAEGYADVVLHYLSKLKNIFTCSRKLPKNHPSSILKTDMGCRYGRIDPREAEKAYAIVDAALQYGYAKEIIQKIGDYYLVRKTSGNGGGGGGRINCAALARQQRAPTPGPDYVRCKNCESLSRVPKGRVSRAGSAQPKRRGRTPSPAHVNYCSKCFSRMKSCRKI